MFYDFLPTYITNDIKKKRHRQLLSGRIAYCFLLFAQLPPDKGRDVVIIVLLWLS